MAVIVGFLPIIYFTDSRVTLLFPEDISEFRHIDDMLGKRVLVTGAAQGIGRVICQHLASRGVIIGALDIQSVDSTVESIQDNGGVAYGLHADVTDPSSVTDAVRGFVQDSGGIEALVNAAALFSTLKRDTFDKLDLEEWDRTFAVNVKSVLLSARAVTPFFIESRQGSIVNIASNVVSYGAANFMQYVSSKSALVGLTRSLARELGDHTIRVNTVSPGMVTTEVTHKQNADDYRQAVIETQCIKEPIRPRDVAELVSFLVSDASRYITGQNLLINAGSHMGPA